MQDPVLCFLHTSCNPLIKVPSDQSLEIQMGKNLSAPERTIDCRFFRDKTRGFSSQVV